MKAIVFTQYGLPDVLELRDVDKPNITDDQVLVKVYASSVNYNTVSMVTGKPFIVRLITGGVRKPKYTIPGNDIAGRVEAVGKSVKRFKPGDEVFGDSSDHGFSAFAEYAAVPESVLTLKPANLSFEEAASVPEAALVALQGLRDAGRIQSGQKVLIVGASGGIGTFAVQFAKYLGAEVTGVCSTRNIELVRAIGADHVIDYTREDFTQSVQRYDLIVATAGYHSIFDYKRALAANGRYVSTGGTMKQIFEALLLGGLVSSGGKKLRAFTVKSNKDLDYVKALLEAGSIKPVIDRCYPLNEVANALRYYGTGRARGKIVIRIAQDRA